MEARRAEYEDERHAERASDVRNRSEIIRSTKMSGMQIVEENVEKPIDYYDDIDGGSDFVEQIVGKPIDRFRVPGEEIVGKYVEKRIDYQTDLRRFPIL